MSRFAIGAAAARRVWDAALAAGFSGDHPDVPASWRVIDEVLADPC